MNYMKMVISILYHPFVTFRQIKENREKIHLTVVLLIVLLAIAIRFTYIYTVHFPLSTLMPRDANLWIEFFIILLPVLLWSVSCFMITSVLGGESTLIEILTATACCLAPYILFTLPLSALSQILTRQELAFFTAAQNLVYLWIGILLFISVKALNNYTMKETIFICILNIFAMGLTSVTALLIYMLVGNLGRFVHSVYQEIIMLFH